MMHANPLGVSRVAGSERIVRGMRDRHVGGFGDDLDSARGITRGVVIGAAIWAVVLVLLLW